MNEHGLDDSAVYTGMDDDDEIEQIERAPEEDQEPDEQELEENTSQIPNHLLPPNKRVILDQERFLPIANISRIMKRLLPSSGKVAKEAKECVQECVSEFISFLTSEACERCRAEKRKTISADDLMKSLINMGFDDYVEPMEIFMRRYRDVNKIAFRPPPLFPITTTTSSYGSTSVTPCVASPPIAITLPPSSQFGSPSTTSSSSVPPMQNTTSPQMQSQSMPVSPSSQVYATVPTTPTTSSQATSPAFAMVAGTPEQSSRTPNVLEPIQLMVDPQTNQHYMVVDNPDGTRELRPVQLVSSDMVQFSGADRPSTSTEPAPQMASLLQTEKPIMDKSPTPGLGAIKSTPRAQKPNTDPYPKVSR